MTRTERDRPAALAASKASQAAIKRVNAQAGHTQGPWSIYFNSQDDLVIRKMFPDGQESHSIARCHSGAANALLIAAAPELLAALQGLVAVLDKQLHSPHAAERASPLGRARAAIAKALGDTE